MKQYRALFGGLLALVALALPMRAVLADPGEIGTAAPEFINGGTWLNSPALTMKELRGKVVLIDFWTYSCINCLRTLPYVTKWYDTYKDKGLVVIGIHTPEFAFERVTKYVQTAIGRFNITSPVVQDNVYKMGQAYDNHYWPADFLIDQKGKIAAVHFGEGDYDKTEDEIRKLLAMNSPVAKEDGPDLSKIGSPEMYFGALRLEDLASPEQPNGKNQVYSAPKDIPLNKFALVGDWKIGPEQATLGKDDGAVELHFHSGKVHMVASAQRRR